MTTTDATDTVRTGPNHILNEKTRARRLIYTLAAIMLGLFAIAFIAGYAT